MTTYADRLISTVREHATTMLDLASDRWGKEHTPLLVDGLHIETREPAPWKYGGRDRHPSNFASQQHLMRVLVGLSEITGDPSGREKAEQITSYVLSHLQHESGLLYWGGHVAWDLVHSESMGHAPQRYHHELKCTYPCYDLMWRVNPAATERFIRALWQAHVYDWQTLDLSRHGPYDPTFKNAPCWEQTYDPKPTFFVGRGLSFCNAGSDLFVAAAMLHHFTGDEAPLTWGKRLAKRYQDTANPKTGLVGYQYSQVEEDRAFKQLGPEFPNINEGNTLTHGRVNIRYAILGINQFQLASTLGEAGAWAAKYAHESLSALANHAYDFENNLLLPGMTDGTPIRPKDMLRPGYYKTLSFTPWTPEPIFFRAYAMAYRHTQDPLMLKTAMRMATGLGLDGLTSSSTAGLNTAPSPADVDLIFGLLELWRTTSDQRLLASANTIAQRIIDERYRDGFFVPQPDQQWVRIDSRDALALLHVAAAHKSPATLDSMPADHHSRVDFTCNHDDFPNATHNRVSDNRLLYNAPYDE